MKPPICRGLSLWLALALLLAFARPAAAHREKVENPEPGYILHGVAVVLYPIADFVNHIVLGPHEKEATAAEEKRRKPKQNFSPRKTHPQEQPEQMEKEQK